MKINARKKGIAYELSVIKTFKEKGWSKACSSRSESKNLDDAGVDICYLPVNVQCKAVENLGSPHKTLAKMPKDGNINLVFHKKNRQGTVVSMTEEDFWKMLQSLQNKYKENSIKDLFSEVRNV